MFYHCLFKLQFLTLLLNEHINDDDIILYYIMLCYCMQTLTQSQCMPHTYTYVYILKAKVVLRLSS